MSLYGTEVIEAHWPMDGPHTPERIEAAGVALAELVRYLNRATLPHVGALTEAPNGAGLVGSLATAAHREMQLCRQLATWARRVAADPTVRHDRHRDDAVTTTPGEVPARTVLEQRIRERRLTFEEFAEYAETFARQHNEPGTLSVRHLQRLAAGRGEHGRPISRPRAATARLLERIFGSSIDELLSRPDMASPSRQLAATAATEAAAELTFAVDVAEELAAFFNRAQNRVNWLSHARPGGDLP